jgi:lipooligosaccharide transport system permease protein
MALSLRRAWGVSDYWFAVYRRTWKAGLVSSILTPLLYVVAMGVILGRFITTHPAGAPSYLAFVVPGLLAAQVFSTTFGEMLWPVFGAIKWQRTYFAMIATPLGIADVVFAHITFVMFRVVVMSSAFLAVLAPFGIFSSVPGVVGAVVAQVLLGLSCAGILHAIASTVTMEGVFALIMRLFMMPLFLFSGAFFPIDSLGPVLSAIAKATPLWHGVDLTRSLLLGTATPGIVAIHVAYLLALGLIGWVLAVRRLERRLIA